MTTISFLIFRKYFCLSELLCDGSSELNCTFFSNVSKILKVFLIRKKLRAQVGEMVLLLSYTRIEVRKCPIF